MNLFARWPAIRVIKDSGYSNEKGTSIVWLAEDGYIHKIQPKYLTENEDYALRNMGYKGFVPHFERLGPEHLKIEYIHPENVTGKLTWMSYIEEVLEAMRQVGIRHGDLTEASVLVHNNKPILIDWAESRLWDDPRPDKRLEGDRYWLTKTMRQLANGKD